MIKRLLSLLLPLLALNLSHHLIVFIDRIFLAQFSLDVMNAVTVAGVTASIFHFSIVSLVSAVEVLVGEYTGANEPFHTSRAAWQMIFVSLSSWVFFIPLGLWGGDFLIPIEYREYGAPYFRIMMFAGPVFPMIAAITSFFVGVGRVRGMIYVVVSTAFANVMMDYLFIPKVGAIGAAWSNVATQIANLVILGGLFFSKKTHAAFGTRKVQLHKQDFLKCLSLGLPTALSYLFDMFAWFLILQLVSKLGPSYLTVYSIGESMIFLFAFFWDSLAKAILAVCSNLMGEQNFSGVKRLFRASFVIYGSFAVGVFILLNVFSDLVVGLFFQDKTVMAGFMDKIKITFFLISLYNFTDGFGWMMTSYLTTFHKNLVAALTSSITIWLVALGPLISMILWGVSFRETLVWELMLAYSGLNSLILYFHFRRFAPT